jgi:hypothetical protein
MGHDLDEVLERLVARDVLTMEQAAAVRAEYAEAQIPTAGASRIPPVVEAAGYLGAVLAAVAAIFVVARFWAELAPWSQLAVLALVAGALWVGGRWVEAPGAVERRITSFLWFWSIGAVAWAGWIAGEGVLGLRSETALFWLSVAATAYAAALWRRLPTAPLQLALFGGVQGVFLFGLALLERPPTEWFGAIVWVIGLAWGVLAWGGLVSPVRAAFAFSGIAAGIGAQVTVFAAARGWGLSLGFVTAALAMGTGTRWAQPALTAIGTVVLAVILPQAMTTWFPGSLAAPLAVLLSGLVLLGGALATVRSRREHDGG